MDAEELAPPPYAWIPLQVPPPPPLKKPNLGQLSLKGGVQGLGFWFRVWGLGFGVWGLGFRGGRVVERGY